MKKATVETSPSGDQADSDTFRDCLPETRGEMTSFTLTRTKQCGKCPWRKDVNPYEIPNGYDRAKHFSLKSTIATPGDIDLSALRAMACHETEDAYCVGWLVNQLGHGNNIALRLKMLGCENAGDIEVVGEQHERFDETIPAQ